MKKYCADAEMRRLMKQESVGGQLATSDIWRRCGNNAADAQEINKEHEAFGRGKLLISLQFDKSVCNNQISLLLQNVSVWLLMRSGAFLPNHTSPTKR